MQASFNLDLFVFYTSTEIWMLGHMYASLYESGGCRYGPHQTITINSYHRCYLLFIHEWRHNVSTNVNTFSFSNKCSSGFCLSFKFKIQDSRHIYFLWQTIEHNRGTQNDPRPDLKKVAIHELRTVMAEYDYNPQIWSPITIPYGGGTAMQCFEANSRVNPYDTPIHCPGLTFLYLI